MGLDIHLYVDRRRPDGQWETVGGRNACWDGRNPPLFRLLMERPRGLPDNSPTRSVEALSAGWDWMHGFSWMPLGELYAVLARPALGVGEAWNLGRMFEGARRLAGPYIDLGDIRLVYAFDS